MNVNSIALKWILIGLCVYGSISAAVRPGDNCNGALDKVTFDAQDLKQLDQARQMLRLGLPTLLQYAPSSRGAEGLRALIFELGKEFPDLEMSPPAIGDDCVVIGLQLKYGTLRKEPKASVSGDRREDRRPSIII